MKLLVSIFFIHLAMSSVAQGNLQFNNILLLEVTCCSPVSFTVPSGKVWKIESSTMSSVNYPMRITSINGISTTGYITKDANSNYGVFPMNLPYWLPSNTQVAFTHGTSGGQKGFVSIIEFNIVP